MVVRDGYIAWVADNINYFFVPRVEALMAFQNARAPHAAEMPVGKQVYFGNSGFYIGERDRLIVNQVTDEKPRPGVTGSWIRHEKNIVGEDGQIPSHGLASGQYTCRFAQCCKDTWHDFLFRRFLIDFPKQLPLKY